MARPLKAEPSYVYKDKGRGRIYWRGKFRDLPGKYKSAESWAEYHRLCAVINQTGEFPPKETVQAEITMRELGVLYLRAMKIKFGKDSNEPTYRSYAIRDCNKLFSSMPAKEFLPPQLKAVRAEIIKSGCVRRTANKRTQQLIKMFQWAVEEGYAEPAQWHRLQAVETIQEGQFGAVDRPKKQPVPDDLFARTLDLLRPEQRDAIQVLALTGMRTGELLAMRPQDVDMTGRHWFYTTSRHKTAKKTGATTILIPEPAADILRARMPRDYTKPWFRHGGTWLRIAVHRACSRADIPTWHPHQLRHRFATKIADLLGEKEAQKLLRHHDPKMTKHYITQTTAILNTIADQLYPDVKMGGGGNSQRVKMHWIA